MLSTPPICRLHRDDSHGGVRDSVGTGMEEGFALAEADGSQCTRKIEGDDVDIVELREDLHGNTNNRSVTKDSKYVLIKLYQLSLTVKPAEW